MVNAYGNFVNTAKFPPMIYESAFFSIASPTGCTFLCHAEILGPFLNWLFDWFLHNMYQSFSLWTLWLKIFMTYDSNGLWILSHKSIKKKIDTYYVKINQTINWGKDPKLGKFRRQWHPTPVLLPGKSHGWRSLVGCSPWGREESDTTEWLHFHFSLSCIGEGNGNPLQCSCLENPRDRGAW